MRILKAGLVYFLVVFGAGFALAFVRLPLLVPRFGVRTAELLEIPVMLAVIVWASRRLAQRHPDLSHSSRLLAGIVALVLLVGAELVVAYALGDRSPSQYIASRDPVSGSVYLASLVFFAASPALWSSRPGPNSCVGRKRKRPHMSPPYGAVLNEDAISKHQGQHRN